MCLCVCVCVLCYKENAEEKPFLQNKMEEEELGKEG